MAKLNLTGIISGLQTVLKAAEEMAPLAQKLGLPPVVAGISTVALGAASVIMNILERGAAVKDALSTEDETKLRSMLSDLQAVNDRLAGEIAAEGDSTASDGA